MAEVLFRAKLTREDSTTPWGFRLQGGVEYDKPLTLLKVVPESLAANGGLHPGDILVKLAGKGADEMSHKDAQETIINSGNSLEIIVERADVTIVTPTVAPASPQLRSSSSATAKPTATPVPPQPSKDRDKPLPKGTTQPPPEQKEVQKESLDAEAGKEDNVSLSSETEASQSVATGPKAGESGDEKVPSRPTPSKDEENKPSHVDKGDTSVNIQSDHDNRTDSQAATQNDQEQSSVSPKITEKITDIQLDEQASHVTSNKTEEIQNSTIESSVTSNKHEATEKSESVSHNEVNEKPTSVSQEGASSKASSLTEKELSEDVVNGSQSSAETAKTSVKNDIKEPVTLKQDATPQPHPDNNRKLSKNEKDIGEKLLQSMKTDNDKKLTLDKTVNQEEPKAVSEMQQHDDKKRSTQEMAVGSDSSADVQKLDTVQVSVKSPAAQHAVIQSGAELSAAPVTDSIIVAPSAHKIVVQNGVVKPVAANPVVQVTTTDADVVQQELQNTAAKKAIQTSGVHEQKIATLDNRGTDSSTKVPSQTLSIPLKPVLPSEHETAVKQKLEPNTELLAQKEPKVKESKSSSGDFSAPIPSQPSQPGTIATGHATQDKTSPKSSSQEPGSQGKHIPQSQALDAAKEKPEGKVNESKPLSTTARPVSSRSSPPKSSGPMMWPLPEPVDGKFSPSTVKKLLKDTKGLKETSENNEQHPQKPSTGERLLSSANERTSETQVKASTAPWRHPRQQGIMSPGSPKAQTMPTTRKQQAQNEKQLQMPQGQQVPTSVTLLPGQEVTVIVTSQGQMPAPTHGAATTIHAIRHETPITEGSMQTYPHTAPWRVQKQGAPGDTTAAPLYPWRKSQGPSGQENTGDQSAKESLTFIGKRIESPPVGSPVGRGQPFFPLETRSLPKGGTAPRLVARTPSPVGTLDHALPFRPQPQAGAYISPSMSPQRLSPQPQLPLQQPGAHPGYMPPHNLSPRAVSPTGISPVTLTTRAPPGYMPRAEPPGYHAPPGYAQRPGAAPPRFASPPRSAAPRGAAGPGFVPPSPVTGPRAGPPVPYDPGARDPMSAGVFAFFDKSRGGMPQDIQLRNFTEKFLQWQSESDGASQQSQSETYKLVHEMDDEQRWESGQ